MTTQLNAHKATERRGLWPRLRRSLVFAAPFRRRLCASVTIILTGTALTLIMPLGIRALLDTALQNRDTKLLHFLALALLGLFVCRAGLSFLGSYLLQVTGEDITLTLRRRVFEHLHRLDVLYVASRRTGDLTTRLVSDTTYIRSVVSENLVTALVQGMQLLGSVAIMVVLDWRLSLIVLALAPGTTILSRFFGPRLREISRQMQDQGAHATTLVFESLSGIQVVKAFGRFSHEVVRYDSALRGVTATYRRLVWVRNLFRGTTGVLTAVCSIAIFWYGGVQVLEGRLSAGDLVAFLFYSQNITASVGQLVQIYGSLSTSAGSADRVFEILDAVPVVSEPVDPIEPATLRGAIQYKNVSFTYEGRSPTIRNVTFEVLEGETVALVGPSGGGKTTIVHLLLRLFDPSAGEILLDGYDLRRLRQQALWGHVALVPQDVFLFGMSIRENIRYGRLNATDTEVEAAARAAQAHDFIERLPGGYETQVGERGVKLSGGQKQRVAIARAFLKDAPILVLDEATSHIDSVSERLVQDAVERLRTGRTTVVVAHRLSTVRNADRILVVQDGRIVEAGTHEELIAYSGMYRHLVTNQFDRSETRSVASLATLR